MYGTRRGNRQTPYEKLSPDRGGTCGRSREERKKSIYGLRRTLTGREDVDQPHHTTDPP